MYLKIQGFYHIIVYSFCMENSGVARKVLKRIPSLEIRIFMGKNLSKILKNVLEKNSGPPRKISSYAPNGRLQYF